MAANLKTNKYVENIKKGFQDIQTVSQEGNFKLFVKQFIVLLVVFLAYRYLTGKFAEKVNNFNGQMEAIRVQKSSEREYQTNKELLLSLEPRFPDISSKNEWLIGQILGIFKEADLTPQVEGTQSEDASNATYVVASQRVNVDMQFPAFAEFLADIENKDEFIKVSEIAVVKDTDPTRLAQNKISLKFNTIFPKEKIAKSLFKDYDKIMKAREVQKQAEKEGK